jgi:putative ABC transport system substrate-binding protein
LVKSLAKPQSNVTGIFTTGGSDALTGKRLSLLKEVVPSVSRIGVMIAADDATEANVLRQLSSATGSLGLTYRTFEVGTSADLESAFAEAARDGLQALFISQNPFFFSRRVEVAAFAARAQLPVIYGFREHTEVGGLMSYGSSLSQSYRQAGRLVAKILKGAKPADLPFEQADKFELVVNNRTAKTLGLKIPDAFLRYADEVIE